MLLLEGVQQDPVMREGSEGLSEPGKASPTNLAHPACGSMTRSLPSFW